MSPLIRLGGTLLLLGLLSACATRPKEIRLPRGISPGDPVMGVYRARLVPEDGKSRRFRMLLFAARPDRLHTEILSPVGTTELILDAGSGKVAVTFVRDRVSYVGSLDDGIVEATLGLPVSIGELVSGILGPEPSTVEGRTIRRAPAGREGLPHSLLIEAGGMSLGLELKRLQPVRGLAEQLGSGSHPPGMDVRALDELEATELPGTPEEP